MGQISFLVWAFVSALICLKCNQIIIEAQAVFTLIKLKQWEYVIIDVMQQSRAWIHPSTIYANLMRTRVEWH